MRLVKETRGLWGLEKGRRSPTSARNLRGMGGCGGGRVRSDNEMSSCSSSSAVASALGKRSYRWITGSAEGATSATGGRGGGAGRRAQWEDATAGDSDSALLPDPNKRKKSDVGRGVDTDTRTGTEAVAVAASVSTTGHEPLESVAELSRVRVGYTTADLGAEIMREMEEIERIASTAKNLKETSVRQLKLSSRRARASAAELQQRTVVTSAVALTMTDLCRLRIRDGAVGDDGARSDDARTKAIGRVIVGEAGSIHSQEQEDGAYLRRRVRYPESKVSHLQETVERLTKVCSIVSKRPKSQRVNRIQCRESRGALKPQTMSRDILFDRIVW
jgi:hypothetical protein